jgi:hypothetical protein
MDALQIFDVLLGQRIDVRSRGRSCDGWLECSVVRLELNANLRVISFDADGSDNEHRFPGLLVTDYRETWRHITDRPAKSVMLSGADVLKERITNGAALNRLAKQLGPKRPLIYIAGPFRAEIPWEIEQNIRCAEAHGLLVARLGGIPVIMHPMYRFFDKALPDAFWLEAGKALLRTCAAVAVCVDVDRAQYSSGTTGEIEEAVKLGLPFFYKAGGTGLEKWITKYLERNT